MIAALEFIFASGWRFAGTVILLAIVAWAIANAALIRIHISPTEE